MTKRRWVVEFRRPWLDWCWLPECGIYIIGPLLIYREGYSRDE